MTGISRRQLFRGDLHGRRRPPRPPWAAPEETFAAACERCGDCVRVCPERVIRIGDGGFPKMDFSLGGVQPAEKGEPPAHQPIPRYLGQQMADFRWGARVHEFADKLFGEAYEDELDALLAYVIQLNHG